jgi:hypothetical protein
MATALPPHLPIRSATDIRSPELRATKIATNPEWDALADAAPYATFFHTREWAELWQQYTGGSLRAVGHLARFDDGVVALLPAVERTIFDLPHVGRLSPTLRTVMSSYGSTYGGWISSARLTVEHHRALWEWTRRFNVCLASNPYDPALNEAGLPWTDRDVTHVVELPAREDGLRSGWSRGHVSAVNKATRAGLTVTAATTAEQWRGYVQVYGLSLRRWEKPAVAYRDDLFEALSRSRSGKVRLWVVEHEGRVIAGAVCLYHGSTVMYWHGAFDADLQHLRAAPLLHAEIMRRAVAGGYRWYDFNPSGGNQGVITFKKRFGARELPAALLVNDAPLKHRLRRSLAALPR